MSELFDIVLGSPTGELEEPSEELMFLTPAPASTIVAEGIINGFGKWSLDENGLLTINGKGDMPDRISDYSDTPVPWKSLWNNVRSIYIADGITRIGNNVFYRFEELTTVYLPNSVTCIGQDAFRACRKLVQIDIPSGVTIIEDCAFWDCHELVHVNLPNTLCVIGCSAFRRCFSLTSITIPNSVRRLESLVFEECFSLRKVTMPQRFDRLLFKLEYGIPKRIVTFT